MNAFDRIQRGVDSSGRALVATRQMWQHFDRVNALVGNRLVIVQGSFNRGTTQSAGTHDLAGSLDIRTWNLTTRIREAAMWAGRDPRQVGGAAWWYRTPAQGFDFHIHLHLLGDRPQTAQTAFQGAEYRAGRNGLASRGPDDFRRPATIVNYQYIEDDMFSNEDAARLKRVEASLTALRAASADRFRAENERDRQLFSRVITRLGKEVDALSQEITDAMKAGAKADSAEIRVLRRQQARLLTMLKDDPDVDDVDNPSDEAMEHAGVQ